MPLISFPVARRPWRPHLVLYDVRWESQTQPKNGNKMEKSDKEVRRESTRNTRAGQNASPCHAGDDAFHRSGATYEPRTK
jgi:hypothetical protein